MPRVHLPSHLLKSALDGEEFDLDPETAKKLTRVLRLGAGEAFVAFDGIGGEWDCALAAVDEGASARRVARAVVLARREARPEGRLRLSVAQAIPKSDKMEWVLQKGTELGVAEFWPFDADRSVSKLLVEGEAERAAVRARRWRKIVEQAAAQCGRADVPIVHAIGDFATAVGYGTNGSRCLMLDEGDAAEPLRAALAREPIRSQGDDLPAVMLMVGPEGGWTRRERETAQRYGAEPVGLGRLILRTETAALVAAAILQWEAGDLG